MSENNFLRNEKKRNMVIVAISCTFFAIVIAIVVLLFMGNRSVKKADEAFFEMVKNNVKVLKESKKPIAKSIVEAAEHGFTFIVHDRDENKYVGLVPKKAADDMKKALESTRKESKIDKEFVKVYEEDGAIKEFDIKKSLIKEAKIDVKKPGLYGFGSKFFSCVLHETEKMIKKLHDYVELTEKNEDGDSFIIFDKEEEKINLLAVNSKKVEKKGDKKKDDKKKNDEKEIKVNIDSQSYKMKSKEVKTNEIMAFVLNLFTESGIKAKGNGPSTESEKKDGKVNPSKKDSKEKKDEEKENIEEKEKDEEKENDEETSNSAEKEESNN